VPTNLVHQTESCKAADAVTPKGELYGSSGRRGGYPFNHLRGVKRLCQNLKVISSRLRFEKQACRLGIGRKEEHPTGGANLANSNCCLDSVYWFHHYVRE
jgi:hypothetical protein